MGNGQTASLIDGMPCTAKRSAMEYTFMDESKPRNQFPSWTAPEQDFWLDMFAGFISVVMDDRISEKSLHKVSWEEGLRLLTEDIQFASLLADIAVEEMQYRFELSGTRREERGRRIIKRTVEPEEQEKGETHQPV